MTKEPSKIKIKKKGIINLPFCTCYRWFPGIWCQTAVYLCLPWHNCEEEASYLKQKHVFFHSWTWRKISLGSLFTPDTSLFYNFKASHITESKLYLWSSQIHPAGRLHTPEEGVATSVATPAGKSGYGPRTESPHRTLRVKRKSWVTGGKYNLFIINRSSLRGQTAWLQVECEWEARFAHPVHVVVVQCL